MGRIISRRDLLKAGVSAPLLFAAQEGVSQITEAANNAVLRPLETLVPISLEGTHGRMSPEGCLILQPGGAPLQLSIDGPSNLAGMAWRLRLIGQVDYDPAMRTPYDFQKLLELIDDALDRENTHHQNYSLLLESDGEPRMQAAYMRALWNFGAQSGQYPLTIWAKRQDLEVLPGGRLGLEVYLYRQRPGRRADDISGLPDATHYLSITGGTSDWQQFSLSVPMDSGVACALFKVFGQGFRGKVWFEDPQFPGRDGVSSLPAFSPAKPFQPFRTWIGINLSKNEWPEFRLEVNGKEAFSGRLFQPEYIWPSTEIAIPPGLLRPGKNDLSLKLSRNYSEQHGYLLREAQWLGAQSGQFEIVACPALVDAGKDFSILVCTLEPNLSIAVDVEPRARGSRGEIEPIDATAILKERGLHFIIFRAGAAGPGATLRFRCGSSERRITVERVVERQEDHVLVGSGDHQWFANHRTALERFFAWRLHHNVGNFILFRPIYYEGGGTRYYDADAWRYAVEMCEKAGIYYALLQNQSELPERGSDPDLAVFKGANYLGSQEHELDGCYYYWAKEFKDPLQVWERDFGNMFRVPERALRFDLFDRNPMRSRLPHPSDPRLASDTFLRYRWCSPHAAKDMREGAEYFIENIRNVIPGGPRHSGPATVFKYFFQAGKYDYLIGEFMYGPFEVVLAALRGASLAYGQPKYGAHIATQWSTTPHDDPAAFRRYFLALATCYIQGVREIYQEDCLWHMEYGFTAEDRFSPACQGHLKVHQEFYRYTRAHSRRGRLRVPVGCLHGQYDGWNCFGADMVWGQAGTEWNAGPPERSWELLKTFFPRSVLAAIFRRPCPHEPVGFFTGTPYGPVDIVPIEVSVDHLQKYDALALLGWNTADENQIERLTEYVENGGRLMLSLMHLSTEVRRNRSPRPLAGTQIRKLLGLEITGLRDSVGPFAGDVRDQDLATLIRPGDLKLGDITLRGATVRVKDAHGTPVLVENQLGRGRVIFLNVAAYPGDTPVAGLYAELMRRAAAEALARQDRIWAQGSEDVSFSVWDWDAASGKTQTSTVYLLNVNWWSETPQAGSAELLWNDQVIPLAISAGRIHAVTVSGDWGIWPGEASADVIGIEPQGRRARVRIQGQGENALTVLYRGAVASARLTGHVGQTPLRFEELSEPGRWRTEIVLDGPLEFELSLDQR